jgi:predicted ABC-type ATPase
MPCLYILTGPNGAGKSTAGPGLLPDSISDRYPPFDGDKLKMIKQQEFKKVTGSYKEGAHMADEFVYEEFERLYKKALSENDHFAYEGHFSEEGSWDLIRKFKAAGYKIDMIFLGLISLELSADRVFNRAIRGGHNVQPYDIAKNYFGNLAKLNEHLDLIDQLTILDTSGMPVHVGQWRNGQMNFNVDDESIPQWVTEYIPRLLESRASKKKSPRR